MQSSLLGMLTNLVLALSKGFAGLLGHSFALVADALESLSDVLSGFAVYLGLKIAVEPPDKDHPYGHGKAEPFAALVVGLCLVAAALFIMVESIHEIRTPHRLPEPFTLVVLAGVLVIKSLLSKYVSGVGSAIHSTAVRADAWHHLSDAITSAFAFVGISVALLIHRPDAMTGPRFVLLS
jgi:cation diffusion facilitator family transporter